MLGRYGAANAPPARCHGSPLRRTGSFMDLKALKEQAVEATARFFLDKYGFAPSEDSEDWEDEYRRQFGLVKKRYATKGPVELMTSPALVVAVQTKDPKAASVEVQPSNVTMGIINFPLPAGFQML